jgi:OPT family small oligopeptide transporter
MTADVYDRYGQVYNVTKVISALGTLDVASYQAYSPPFLGASFAFVYGTSFASITSALVHVYLWHGTDIWEAWKGRQALDIHARLMLSYKKTPWYWYAGLTVAVVALAIAMVETYAVDLPVYGVFLALIIPAVYMIPCGIIQGITNVDANQLNVLAEFTGGYMFSGRPLANMVFKYLSVDVVNQGIFFAQDMKLAHYMKVAPRKVFFAQCFAAVSILSAVDGLFSHFAQILGALTQVGVTLWMLGNIHGICTKGQSDGFSCPNGRTTYSSSVIWGAIGPGRLYSAGKIYSGLLHFFWIGALMPVVTWLIWKRTDTDFWAKINWPLIFVGTWNVPPATGINYSSWALVNWIFNGWIKKKYFAWWTKYNYVLAAALDTGTALSGIIIFFCISYPGAVFPSWWGNTVYVNTADGKGVPYLDLPESGYFGPANGTWT